MTKHKQWLIAVLISLLGVIVHLGALSNEPVFDDPLAVEDNPATEQPLNLATHFGSGFWGPKRPDIKTWRPLVTLTYSWNRWVHGLEPLGYRLVNLLLHGGAVFLFFLLALHLGLGLSAAVLAGILFAVHPIHVDAIVTYSGRADLLMTVFALLAFWLYEKERYIASTACLGLSLLSKEMAVVAAVVIVWRYWSTRLSRGSSSPSRSHWAWIAPAILVLIWIVARYAVLGTWTGPKTDFINNPLAYLSYPERILPALSLYHRAVVLLVAPFSLAADLSYAAFDPGNIPLFSSIFGGLLLLVSIGGTLYTVRSNPSLSCCLALWVGGYLLISHLGPTLPMVFGERTLYMPSAGLLMGLGFGLNRLIGISRFRRGTWVTAAIVAAVFSMRSAVRVEDWRDNETFIRALHRDAPNNIKALTRLSVIEHLGGNNTRAVALAERALLVGGNTREAHLNAAQLYIALHNGQKAGEHLALAEKFGPDLPCVITARCAWSSRFQQPGAVQACRRAIEEGNDELENTIHFAVAHSNSGDTEEAEETFHNAIEMEGLTGVRALHSYATFLALRKDFPKARQILIKGLTRQPDSRLLLDTLHKVDKFLTPRDEQVGGGIGSKPLTNL